MTIKQIQQIAYSNGLPLDYPLRGTKAQQIQSIFNFFQTIVDWQVLANSDEKAIAKAKTERDNIKKLLDLK